MVSAQKLGKYIFVPKPHGVERVDEAAALTGNAAAKFSLKPLFRRDYRATVPP